MKTSVALLLIALTWSSVKSLGTPNLPSTPQITEAAGPGSNGGPPSPFNPQPEPTGPSSVDGTPGAPMPAPGTPAGAPISVPGVPAGTQTVSSCPVSATWCSVGETVTGDLAKLITDGYCLVADIVNIVFCPQLKECCGQADTCFRTCGNTFDKCKDQFINCSSPVLFGGNGAGVPGMGAGSGLPGVGSGLPGVGSGVPGMGGESGSGNPLSELGCPPLQAWNYALANMPVVICEFYNAMQIKGCCESTSG